jgi:hypothetical protein
VPGLRLHHASFNSDLRAMWQTAACHTVVTPEPVQLIATKSKESIHEHNS